MYWQGRRQSTNVEELSPLANALAVAQAREYALEGQMGRALASGGLRSGMPIGMSPVDRATAGNNWSRYSAPGFRSGAMPAMGMLSRHDTHAPQRGLSPFGTNFGMGLVSGRANGGAMPGYSGLLGSPQASDTGLFGGLFGGLFNPQTSNDPGYGAANSGGSGGKGGGGKK